MPAWPTPFSRRADPGPQSLLSSATAGSRSQRPPGRLVKTRSTGGALRRAAGGGGKTSSRRRTRRRSRQRPPRVGVIAGSSGRSRSDSSSVISYRRSTPSFYRDPTPGPNSTSRPIREQTLAEPQPVRREHRTCSALSEDEARHRRDSQKPVARVSVDARNQRIETIARAPTGTGRRAPRYNRCPHAGAKAYLQGRAQSGQSRLRMPVSAATTAVVSTQPARIDAQTHQRTHPVGIQAASWLRLTTGSSTSSAYTAG